jgi:1,4-dihydroxy-2-naphthoate polyprenyltransferase
MDVKLFLRTIRAPFLTATIVPVLAGAALAWQQSGRINVPLLLMTLLGAISFQVGANVFNDYFDHKSGNDQASPKISPYSGGSRVIQEKSLSPAQVRQLGTAAYLLGSLIGIYLLFRTDIRLLYFGLTGMLLGYFYTAKPLQLAYHGLGEIICGIVFGPLIVAGTYFVQTCSLSVLVVVVSLPIGLLIAAVLLINEFTDQLADSRTGKKTLVVRVGRKISVKIYTVLLCTAYVLVLYMAAFFKIPHSALLCFLTLPLAVMAIGGISRKPQDRTTQINTSRLTIQLHLCFGLFLALGLVLPF